MTRKDFPPDEEHAPAPAPKTESNVDRKHRKHGYRGYPNQPAGGTVHIGSGFSGMGSTAGGGTSLSDSGIIGERTRETVEDEDEE